MLVVGTAGGLKLVDIARVHPGWRIEGVDTSQTMMDLAAQWLQSAGVSYRVPLHHGYV